MPQKQDHALARVLVVEDDVILRRHFESAIATHPELELLGSVGSCKEAEALLPQCPDVMLVDLGLPDGDGIGLIRQLKKIHPAGEAMVVSVFDEEAKVVGAIRAGASGYLLKNTPGKDIGETVVDVLNGASPISPSIARFILKALSTPVDKKQPEHKQENILSEREVQVLNLFARGLSRKEIAVALDISLHTAVTHTRHIYEKMKVNSRDEAIFEANQLGLIDSADSPH